MGRRRDRAVGRGHGPWGRAGSGLGRRERESERSGGVRGEGQAPWGGIGTTCSSGPPEEPGHHAQQRLPGPSGRTTERRSCGGTRSKARNQACKTAENRHGRTPQRDTDQENGGHGAESRQGPELQAGTRIQGPKSLEGRKWPVCPNLPSAAFPDFEGVAGVKFLMANSAETKLRLRAMDFLRERKTATCLGEVARRRSTRSGRRRCSDGGEGRLGMVRTFGLVSGLSFSVFFSFLSFFSLPYLFTLSLSLTLSLFFALPPSLPSPPPDICGHHASFINGPVGSAGHPLADVFRTTGLNNVWFHGPKTDIHQNKRVPHHDVFPEQVFDT